MEITKQHLIDTIHKINDQVDELIGKLDEQARHIKDIEQKNRNLVKNNESTSRKIEEYIKELEQIRNHYVDSNNNTR
jgi:chromosome segregation ATPase